MTEAEFWTIVTATNSVSAPEEAAAELRNKLSDICNQGLADFDKRFSQSMRKAFTWNLWGAAFVMAGCNSEDGFIEFRSWLISRGQSDFEKALASADSIADFEDIPKLNQLYYPYLDDYDLVAGIVFEERNNQELDFVPSGLLQPKGKRFKDKPKFLKKQYPKLFAKYRST